MKRVMVVAVAGMVALAGPQVSAQTGLVRLHEGKGGSPHVRMEWVVDGATITIEYGRPYLKGRPEATVMPRGKEWRTGADEATVLKIDRPIRFGTLAVPAGTYQIHTVPGDSSWQLIISKSTQVWGIPYPAGQDLGRAPMTVTKLEKPVEQLTFGIDDTREGGLLRIEWGTTSARIPFTVGN